MPELPEVETMRVQLEKFLVGSTIDSVEILNPKYEIQDKSKILNSKVIKVRRFAKVTSVDLSNGFSILTHVKLTGQFIYRGPNLKNPKTLSKKVAGGVPGPHTHVVFHFKDGGKLYYNDIRRFGWIKFVKSDKIQETSFISKLGPEPHVAKGFAGQALTFDLFQQILQKTARPIKVVLMDQSKIGGIGNIYANDALWDAAISPKRLANSLKPKEQGTLYNSILKVLKAGLKYGGASELAFVTPDGVEGEYQNHTLVFNHTGELCARCKKSKIEKYFLGGRGTYWCPNCQK